MSDENEMEQKPIKERRVTPELKAAMRRYIPITTDPIDRFTPDFFKEEYPPEKWPVIHIKKPGTLDIIRSMERAGAALKEVKAVESSEPVTDDKAEKKSGHISPDDVAVIGREAMQTWRERVIKFENLFAANKSQVVFEAKDGVITDACLNMVPWETFLAVHFRYDSLFGLTELEREGLEYRPASA